MTAAWTLLHNLFELDIHAAQWIDYKEYSTNPSDHHVFILKTTTKPMSLPRPLWVRLNCLRTDVGHFQSSMRKWDLAPTSNCECGAAEQTADHIILTCPTHQAPTEIYGLVQAPAPP